MTQPQADISAAQALIDSYIAAHARERWPAAADAPGTRVLIAQYDCPARYACARPRTR